MFVPLRMPQIRRTTILWIAAWAATVPVALARAGLLAESDTFWEIRTGQVILATGRIPRTDPFSWTAYGRPWRPNSWGFDVLLAPAYRYGGLTAVALLGAVLVLLVVAAMLVLARRLGAGPGATAVVLLLAMPLLVAWFAVRPQLADYAAVAVLLMLVERLAAGRRPVLTIIAMGVLHAVWVNLHAAATLGVALAAAAGAASVATGAAPSAAGAGTEPSAAGRAGRRWVVAGWFGAAVAAAAAGTLTSPAGTAILTQGLHVHDASTGLIVEWQRLDVTDPTQAITVLAGLSALGAALYRRWWRPVAVLGVLAAGSVAAVRFQPILAVCAVPVLAAAVDTPALRRWATRRRVLLRIAVGTLVVAYGVLAAQAVPHLGRPAYPVRPTAALPSGCRLVNSNDLGGLVILLRPDVPVSVDSRNDLYGRTEALRFKHLVDRGTPAELDPMGVDCALVPARSGLGQRLAADPGWLRLADDRGGSVFVRRDG